MVRRHFYFSGRVQGVGFRYQAAYLARSLRLTGWVRNLSDGRVELEVQGDGSRIAELVRELRQVQFIRIEEMESEERPILEEEKHFRTRFSL